MIALSLEGRFGGVPTKTSDCSSLGVGGVAPPEPP